MGDHARLSPSNIRWPVCPGSIREEAQYPEQEAGAAAIDGTGSHLLLEMCLNEGVDAKHYLHQTIGKGHEDCPEGWRVEYDRAERVQMALDYIERRKQEVPDLEVGSEARVNPGYWFGRDDWWGTCDVLMVSVHPTEGLLEVVDYKDGRGWVSEDTRQLVSYALGNLMPFLHPGGNAPLHRGVVTAQEAAECAIRKVRLTIVQPRTNPPVRYREVGTECFFAEAMALVDAAFATDDPDAPLVPGKHCQWCAHKPNCSARSEEKAVEQTKQLSVVMPDTASLAERLATAPDTVPAETLSQFLDAWKALSDLHEMVEKEARRRIEAGGSVPGYIVAPGRVTRKWVANEEEMWKKLRNMGLKKSDAFDIKLKSPAKIEALPQLTERQKKRLAEFIAVIDGKPKLKKGTPKTEKDVSAMFRDIPTLEPAAEVATETLSFL